MANWLSLKQISEKRGIAESTLREWKNLGYIASSIIDNVVMLDDESMTRFLNLHQTRALSEDYLEKLIREKELEREVLLSQLDDELFLMKTQKLHQALFDILIQELGQLITDEYQREIFLAISSGEPIVRVAERHKISYAEAVKIYSCTLDKLSKNSGRIATFRNRAMSLRFGKFNTTDPTNTLLKGLIDTHAYGILLNEAGIETIRELLQYVSLNGWHSLLRLRGLGEFTYQHIINTLSNANFIIVHKDGSIDWAPEIAAQVI